MIVCATNLGNLLFSVGWGQSLPARTGSRKKIVDGAEQDNEWQGMEMSDGSSQTRQGFRGLGAF